MLVEFLGLPASGKTTTLKAADARLKALGLTCHSVQDLDRMDKTQPAFTRRSDMSRSLFRYEQFRDAYADCAALIDRFGAAQPLHKTLLTSLCARFQIHATNAVQDRVFATDEGFTHRAIYMIGAYGQDTDTLMRAFCQTMPLPDRIILLDVPAATCYQRALHRLAARKNTSASHHRVIRRIHEVHGDQAGFEARADLMEIAATTLKTRGVAITRIPPEADPDAAATLAATAIAQTAETIQAA